MCFLSMTGRPARYARRCCCCAGCEALTAKAAAARPTAMKIRENCDHYIEFAMLALNAKIAGRFASPAAREFMALRTT